MFGLGTKEWASLDSLAVFGNLEDAITKGICPLAKVFCATSVKLEEEGMMSATAIKTRFQDQDSEGLYRKAAHKRTGELNTRALEPLGELRGAPGGRHARRDDQDPGV